jgi:hypothetical protein
MTALTFSTDVSLDTNSSPFYGYFQDTMFVGDDNGYLHKFSGVFNGTPSEVTGGGWPVNVTTVNGAQNKLTSPVLDEGVGTSGIVYVADSGGYLYSVDAGTGAVVSSAQVAFGSGIAESPTVDPTNNTVYVFATSTGAGCSGAPAVLEFPYNFASGASPATTAYVGGPGNCPSALYAGAFDNLYFTNTGTGNMYICGEAPGSVTPTLYQIAVSGTGTLGSVTPGPELTSAVVSGCSPVTEVYNPSITTDLIFLSVPASGQTDAQIDCPLNTGCVMAFNVSSGQPFNSGIDSTAAITSAGGASGIIIDNTINVEGATGGGSQIYYTPLSTTPAICTGLNGADNIGIGGCAIQATQIELE